MIVLGTFKRQLSSNFATNFLFGLLGTALEYVVLKAHKLWRRRRWSLRLRHLTLVLRHDQELAVYLRDGFGLGRGLAFLDCFSGLNCLFQLEQLTACEQFTLSVILTFWAF